MIVISGDWGGKSGEVNRCLSRIDGISSIDITFDKADGVLIETEWCGMMFDNRMTKDEFDNLQPHEIKQLVDSNFDFLGEGARREILEGWRFKRER